MKIKMVKMFIASSLVATIISSLSWSIAVFGAQAWNVGPLCLFAIGNTTALFVWMFGN